ncbi:MAG: aminoglycoside phosphotransferase [Actinobacteria bacterium]|nr:aminoglycoside phosphotransferase [Actinomycetota bacterium]
MTDLWQTARECAEQWGLTLEPPLEDRYSLVIPAGDVVLKVNADWHFEAEHEPDALELWGGRGAVRVLARDAARRAFLIERCRPGTRLWDADVDGTAVVAGLLPRLSLEPEGHPFRSLADEADRWAYEVPKLYEAGGRPFERRLLDAAVDVFRSVDRTAGFLVNQDLHGGNILRAEREPWLVIDPKPLVGEPELDGVGLLRNANDPCRWINALAELGYDRDRLRGWGFAHALAWGWDEEDGWNPTSVTAAEAIYNSR